MNCKRLVLCVLMALLAAWTVTATPAQATVSEAEALTTAVSKAAHYGLKSGQLQIGSSGVTLFDRARSVFYTGNETVTGGGSNTPAYPFVLTNGGTFDPLIHHPPGDGLPPVKYLGLLIGTTPNELTEVYLGETAPAIGELGTVVTITLPSTEATAASGSCHVDQLLVTALGRKHLGARLASAQHSLKACEARHR